METANESIRRLYQGCRRRHGREWRASPGAEPGECARRRRFHRHTTSNAFSVPGTRTSPDPGPVPTPKGHGRLDFATAPQARVSSAWKNSLSLDGADLSFRRGGRYASSTATRASARVVPRLEPPSGVVSTRLGFKTCETSQDRDDHGACRWVEMIIEWAARN